MTAPAWVALSVVGLAILVWWIAARIYRRSTEARAIELASRPKALRDAKLVYMEKLFRVQTPIRLVARLDRAYRTPDGQIVLVELKTRWIHKAYLADVIQLSAQRVAVLVQSGEPVAPFGYVLVRSPAKRLKQSVHRVDLLPQDELTAIASRRSEILAGRTLPRYAASTKVCRRCAYRQACDRPRDGLGA